MSDIKETKTGFSSIADNYVYTEANDDISVDELTVTITLNEYRKLITDQAMMKVEMFDLKKKLDEFEENADSMQQTSECRSAFITPFARHD